MLRLAGLRREACAGAAEAMAEMAEGIGEAAAGLLGGQYERGVEAASGELAFSLSRAATVKAMGMVGPMVGSMVGPTTPPLLLPLLLLLMLLPLLASSLRAKKAM